MNFAPLFGAIAATAAIRRTSEERRKYEEGFASRRHQAIERFEQLEDEAGQSVDELRTKQQDIEARLNEIFPPNKTNMTAPHPITPTPELVQEWWESTIPNQSTSVKISAQLCTKAAQWGADQELEACCEWLDKSTVGMAELLRDARRPKPLSLKEQALEALKRQSTRSVPSLVSTNDCETIRRALEALPE
jgi:hypothetical protein